MKGLISMRLAPIRKLYTFLHSPLYQQRYCQQPFIPSRIPITRPFLPVTAPVQHKRTMIDIPISCGLIIALFSRTANGRETWDDYANNFATDLAPILQLFGEPIVKQFLSESTSILDSVIFAMGPLGVITTIVSLIRVCGTPELKAFIGRAQEGAGQAEVELCSSTGRDICEMFQNGAITRVVGRPKLLQFVYVPPDMESDQSDGLEYRHVGIYTFEEYLQTPLGKEEWKELEPTRLKESRLESAKQPIKPSLALNPNLALNIGIRKPPSFILKLCAILGGILQMSVLILASYITYCSKLEKESRLPKHVAFSALVIGTTLLSGGMFMSSYIIDHSTVERAFTRSEAKSGNYSSSMHWVQPGGQVIGDHSFDFFAYNDSKRSLRSYISSIRKPISPKRLQTWIAIIMTILGFILQFVGLRCLHALVSIYHLIVLLSMSIMRALLRTRRKIESDDDYSQRPSEDIPLGHELDWLAFRLNGAKRSSLKQGFQYWDLRLCSQMETESSVDSLQRILTSQAFNSDMDTQWLRQWERPKQNNEAALDTATRLWRYRVRLGHLTSPSVINKSSSQQAWPESMVHGRRWAACLSTAINATANVMLLGKYGQGGEKLRGMFVKFECTTNYDQDRSTNTCLHFLLRARFNLPHDGKSRVSWYSDPLELEAAISLRLWSLYCKRNAEISGNASERRSTHFDANASIRRQVVLMCPKDGYTNNIPELDQLLAWRLDDDIKTGGRFVNEYNPSMTQKSDTGDWEHHFVVRLGDSFPDSEAAVKTIINSSIMVSGTWSQICAQVSLYEYFVGSIFVLVKGVTN